LGTFEEFQFRGRGQQKTPAGTFQQFLEVAAHLPGLPFDRLRKEQADIATGAASGDLALADSVVDRHVQQPGLSALRDGPREAASESMQRLAADRGAQPSLPFTPEMLVSPSFDFSAHGLDFPQYLNLRGQFLAQENERLDNEHKRKLEEQDKQQSALDKEHKRKLAQLKLEQDHAVAMGKVAVQQTKAECAVIRPQKRPRRVTLMDSFPMDVYRQAVMEVFGDDLEAICEACKKGSVNVAKYDVDIVDWAVGDDALTEHIRIHCGCLPGYSYKHRIGMDRLISWFMHQGPVPTGKCNYCKDLQRLLHLVSAWDAGHHIAHSKGGTSCPTNLRPIHPACNRAMGVNGFAGEHCLKMSQAEAKSIASYLLNNRKRRPRRLGPEPGQSSMARYTQPCMVY
jgi:hypothetical protein